MSLLNRLRAFFRREKLESNLDDELRFHLEMKTRQNLEAGMPREEARQAALRQFGNVARLKEDTRRAWSFPRFESLLQDLRYGLRQLRRNPGFTAVAVLTLALGIGANTAIFSVVNAVVLRPLPYPQSGRLVWIAETLPALKTEIASGGDYVDWKNQSKTLDQITAFDDSASFNMTGRGTPARVHGAEVSASFFSTLGVDPQLGRSFTAGEDEPNGPHVVVLMHAFWQQYFGSESDVLGQTVTLDGAPYTVLGVMPASFKFPGDAEAQILLPLQLNEVSQHLGMQRFGVQRFVRIIGRLKPGISIARAHNDLDAIRKRAQFASAVGPMRFSGPNQGRAPAPPGAGPNMMMRFQSSNAPPPAGGPGIAMKPPTGVAPGNVEFGPRSGPAASPQSAKTPAETPQFFQRQPPPPSGTPSPSSGAQTSGEAPRFSHRQVAPPTGAKAAPAVRPRSMLGPNSPPGTEIKVEPLAEHLAGNLRPAMLILLGVVGLVLLIACANVANLTLARASTRAREVAVRAALGAGRRRLVRQMLSESVVLALGGGLAGLISAAWGVDAMTRVIPSNLGGQILSQVHPHLDVTVLLFALAVSLVTGILFGLAPAVAATRPDLAERLKEGSQVARASAGGGWLRGSLAVTELSLALVLLIGAGLLLKSFYRMLSVNLGFAPEHVLTVNLNLTDSRYPSPEQKLEFFSEVLRRVESLPGVRSAALSDSLPLSPYRVHLMMRRDLVSQPGSTPGSNTVQMSRLTVSPGYFYTLGIPLLKGRTFTDQDNEQAPKVAVVNEALARHFWPGLNPIGRDVPFFYRHLSVVGVVGNTHHNGPGENVESEVYVPYLQAPEDSMQLAVRTAVEPTSLASAVRAQVAAIDSQQPISNVTTLEQTLSQAIAPRRFNVLLLGIFAAIALALATVGIYGVMAFSVTQRTHEIGIRMALGAQPSDVLRLIVGQGFKLTLIGIAIGIGGALALTRFLSSLLFGVKPTDPATFVAVSLILILVALLATYIPARRATQVDPMVALRYE